MRTDEDLVSTSMGFLKEIDSGSAVADEPACYRLCVSHRDARLAHGATESCTTVRPLIPLIVRIDIVRTGQKILKPAFFEAFRTERASAEAINSAAAHIASRAMANNDWAGLQSSKVLVTETIPMIAKIQAQASGECPALKNTRLLMARQNHATD